MWFVLLCGNGRSRRGSSAWLIPTNTITITTTMFTRFSLSGCCGRRIQRRVGKLNSVSVFRPSQYLVLKTCTTATRKTSASWSIDATLEESSEVAQIKRHLRKMLSYFINLSPQRRRIFALIRNLEQRYSSLTSWGQLTQQLEGNWKLVFSSTTLGVPSTDLVVSKLTQTLGKGQLRENGCYEIDMVNTCEWNYVQLGTRGELEIFCMLTFLGRCRFMCRVLDYRMETHDQVKAQQARFIVGYLQRNLPREFFDPNNCMLQISFVDDELRIVKWLGKKFAGVRNIFYRYENEPTI